jgi:hypothetical protein
VAPTRAYSFATHTAGSTVVVTLPPTKPAVEQDLRWTVFADHAELVATLKVTAKGDDLMLIEWDVPVGVTVAELTGDNVRGWTRVAGNEGRLQVWLKQPARTATLQLRGWNNYPKTAPGQALRWKVPVLRCPEGVNLRTVLQASEAPVVQAAPDSSQFLNLVRVPQTSLTWVCTTAPGFYRAEFLLRPATPVPQVLALSSVEVRDGLVQVTSFLEIQIPHAGAATFGVRVKHGQGPPLTPDDTSKVNLRWRERRSGEQHWEITVPAAAPRRLVLKLAGSLSASAGLQFDLPRINLEGAEWIDHWVAASTPGLHVQAAQQLTPVKDNRALPGFIAERFGKPALLWKAARSDWQLSLSVVTPAAAPGIQVLHVEQQAVFADGVTTVRAGQL